MYKTEFKIKGTAEEVFNALHQYKKNRQPIDLFGTVLPSWLVKINFRVLSDNTLGLGAIYDWEFKIFGITILKFQEKIVEWEEQKLVAYESISRWKMSFRTELTPIHDFILLKTQINFSPFHFVLFDWLFTPVVKWGLNKVNKKLKKNIEINRNKNKVQI